MSWNDLSLTERNTDKTGDPFAPLLDHIARTRPADTRPAITLTWAQSLDGSIATRERKPLALSGPESLRMTHRLRAAHDGILVGIGAVLADNPRLTVRGVVGEHPQPIVLDTHLRFPPDAALLAHPNPPWIFTGPAPDPAHRLALEAARARIFPQLSLRAERSNPQATLEIASSNDHSVVLLAMTDVLERLRLAGIQRLMVEGGATVIGNFLQTGWIDNLVITLSPCLAGGLSAVPKSLGDQISQLPRLKNPSWMQAGDDLVVWGDGAWSAQ